MGAPLWNRPGMTALASEAVARPRAQSRDRPGDGTL